MGRMPTQRVAETGNKVVEANHRERHCAICRKKLSIYQTNGSCWACLPRYKDMLDRGELKKSEAKAERQRQRQRRKYQNDRLLRRKSSDGDISGDSDEG